MLTDFAQNILGDEHEEDYQSLAESPTVKELLNYQEPILHDDLSVEVLNRFVRDSSLFSLAIVDKLNRPVGLIDRGTITEIFVKPYARDLHYRQLITEIMIDNPVIVDIHTTIDDLAKIIIDSGMRHMSHGFIIVQNEVYVGLSTGHALLEEITRRKQRDLYYLAHYDQLTGVPNRLLFKDRLVKSCQNAHRSEMQTAVMFIDLDRFKFYNDTLGHSFGDLILINVAKRLSECIRKSDTVARLGGDEFVIILQNIINVEDCENVAEKIVESVRQPMTIYERDVNITASLGVALFPLHANSVDEVIAKADAAMYEIKQQGRNNYLIYSPDFDLGLIERNSLEINLKEALENGQFTLVYQPQVNLLDNSVIGVEALLRWHSPTLGFVPPNKFIPVAEDCGVIHELGLWVLDQACLQHKKWLEKGLPSIKVAVNVSAIQLDHEDFLENFKAVIDAHQIDPAAIELELTEGIMLKQMETTLKTLNALKDFGVRISIDDFGTGYSSLSYLRKLPLDKIKIDRSFITNIHTTSANEAIFTAIMALAKNLSLEVIAEGVETRDELKCVLGHQCIEAQGYFFSKPLPADDLVSWLGEHNDVVSST